MKKEIIRTVYHFKDDKGWDKEDIVEGDIVPSDVYRIPKCTKLLDKFNFLSSEPPLIPEKIEFYEFNLVKESYEHFSMHYYIKHLFYEMRVDRYS